MKTEAKTIRGVDVRVTQVPALRGFKLLAEVCALSPGGDIRQAVFSIRPEDVETYAIKFLSGARALVGDSLIDLDSRDKINRAFPDPRALLEAIMFALSVQLESYSDAPDDPPPAGASEND